MYLRKLLLSGFKNHLQAEFTFSEKINCIVGNNGVGKTNLLDAIYYLSFCKSFFSAQDLLNVRHGHDFFAIHGTYCLNDLSDDLVQCIQRKTHRKKFMVNKKEYERMADHIGRIPLVMISPYDRDLINDGSELRRKYIDSVISQFDREYLDHLINYNKALAQRNALLKIFAENNRFDNNTLEVWDEQLIFFGEKIHNRRKIFLIDFIPCFRDYFLMISNHRESVDIRYQSALNEKNYRDLFNESLHKDRISQVTNIGVHRDDLEFLLEGYPVKRFASQGQQKSFVIAIKLAQFELTRKVKGVKPILLLDDIFDKLDDHRVAQLINLVNENSFGQVFITDTNYERVLSVFDNSGIDHSVFHLPAELDNSTINE
jgi:DNA replication and repair protein RecF